ncbi:vWA domain-containing protein [Aureivirga sp. CE67]|uniref:vWA domain-containing protein n=1 Tax=Aureivirga sp. CE67 TaxID=1788983 RepID=UPI0018CBAB29|nr:vWA domain-containing protein [Aureivirga sp. CE67]
MFDTTTIFYLILAFVLAIAVSYLFYFFGEKKKEKSIYFLFGLRTLSIFLILLLFINPVITRKTYETIKPKLAVLLDNSSSVVSVEHNEKSIRDLFKIIESNKEIEEKFDVDFYQFSEDISVLDSLNFDGKQTDISKALQKVERVYKNEKAPMLLLSDGNSTKGNDFAYFQGKQQVYPVILGDTISYSDLKINQVNVNRYAALDNNFPVEIFTNYEGNQPIKAKLLVKEGNSTVFSQDVNFDANKTSETINFYLKANKKGFHKYRASLVSSDLNEKNTQNNHVNFVVEVVEEQSKILILSDFVHPDVGMFKKIVANDKKQSVVFENIKDYKGNLAENDLVILYQPTRSFSKVFQQLKNTNQNYFVITGASTDWNFLNNAQDNFEKKSGNLTENFTPSFNSGFMPFITEDIGFSDFAPVKGKLGKVSIQVPTDVLLYQQVEGIETEEPLLATMNPNNEQKIGILFGEDIWRWRMQSFLNEQSFSDFDMLFSKLFQYLSSTKKLDRLKIDYNQNMLSSEENKIFASYFDSNFNFDSRAKIWLDIKNSETNKTYKLPFSSKENYNEVSLEEIPAGKYSFNISVENEKEKKQGFFEIIDFDVEKQLVSANTEKLNQLASNTGGKTIYPNQLNSLLKDLVKDQKITQTQKEIITQENLISWEWLLGLLVFLLSLEWFIRKYLGKI